MFRANTAVLPIATLSNAVVSQENGCVITNQTSQHQHQLNYLKEHIPVIFKKCTLNFCVIMWGVPINTLATYVFINYPNCSEYLLYVTPLCSVITWISWIVYFQFVKQRLSQDA